jgi:hypothetical protein
VSIPNNFAERTFATVRRHGSVLLFPTIFLGFLSAGFFFLGPKLTEVWQHQALLISVIVLAVLFWLFPSIRFFTNRYEISSNRVVVHRGLSGNKIDQAAWGELTGVSVTRGFGLWLRGAGNIHLHREFGVDLVLHKVPRAKKLAREFESFMAARSRVGE